MLQNTYYNPCNDDAVWTRQPCNSWGCLTQIQSSILCDGWKAGTLGTARTGSGCAWDSTQLYLFKRGDLQQPPSPADLLWRPARSLRSRQRGQSLVSGVTKSEVCFNVFLYFIIVKECFYILNTMFDEEKTLKHKNMLRWNYHQSKISKCWPILTYSICLTITIFFIVRWDMQ